MRYQIDRNVFMLPLLAAFGGTESASYLDLSDTELHCKFGFLFDEVIPLSEIESIDAQATWPWYGGIGWRTNMMGAIAIVGSLRNIVCIKLRPGLKARLFLKLPLKELYVSLEDRDGFVKELRDKLAPRETSAEARPS